MHSFHVQQVKNGFVLTFHAPNLTGYASSPQDTHVFTNAELLGRALPGLLQERADESTPNLSHPAR